MSIECITHKQHFSEILDQLSKIDDELSYQRTSKRLVHMGSVVRASMNSIRVQTEGEYAYLSGRTRAVY